MFSLNYLIISHDGNYFHSEILSKDACVKKLVKKYKISLEEAKKGLVNMPEDLDWTIWLENRDEFKRHRFGFSEDLFIRYNSDGDWLALLNLENSVFAKNFCTEDEAYKFLKTNIVSIIFDNDTPIRPKIFKLSDRKFIDEIKDLTKEKKFRNNSGIYSIDIQKIMAS